MKKLYYNIYKQQPIIYDKVYSFNNKSIFVFDLLNDKKMVESRDVYKLYKIDGNIVLVIPYKIKVELNSNE